MENFRMVYTGSSYFGKGTRTALLTEIKKRGFRKVMVVTDPGIERCGITEKVTDVLKNGSIPYTVFDRIKPNPTIENVQDGLSSFEAEKADLLVAVGGGSVIDTAKAIAIIANNPENRDVISLEGIDKNKKPGIPIIAFPTTAGTGSETTMDYVITNTKEKRKMSCMSSTGVPVAAILDTELMAGLPVRMSAATGMDALTHAVESYLAKGANIFSETLSIRAVSLIAEYLPKVIENPSDLDARMTVAVAEYFAGMSFTNAGLGIVHSMAHPLSAFYDIPHGVANALILPYVLAFNSSACPDKMPKLLNAFCPDYVGDEDPAEICCARIRALNQMAGLPSTLHEIGVKPEAIDLLALSAFKDVATLDNPRPVIIDDLKKLYQQMF